MVWRDILRLLLAGALLPLSACISSDLAPRETEVTPQVRPAAPAPAPEPPKIEPKVVAPKGPSAKSIALAEYYQRREDDLLARGLLRVDGGGPDTLFTDEMLIRDFRDIALKEEYQRLSGLQYATTGQTSAIKKWTQPVRVVVETGRSVSAEQAGKDRAEVRKYTQRLARLTGHDIAVAQNQGNFHVMFLSADELDQVAPRILSMEPNADLNALRIFDDLPQETQCIVIAFASTPGGYEYDTAVAVIRSEHPDLMRLACIHEEIAQGLGLSDDSAYARPSIFNDDDEFSLLTNHDELLLKILYDPALTPGMSEEQALPIVRRQAAALVGSGAI